MRPLKTNGLIPAVDFPVEAYEAVHDIVLERWVRNENYSEFAAAWTAVSYRFESAVKAGEQFHGSFLTAGATPAADERFRQDSALADFFSNGYSTLESVFYGLFAVGACLEPSAFSLATAKARQQVSPSSTAAAFKKHFAGDALVLALDSLIVDAAYIEWKEIRNVLTHRSAPGRKMFVGFGVDDAPPTEWKLKNLVLDETLIPVRRAALVRMVSGLINGVVIFLHSRTHAQ